MLTQFTKFFTQLFGSFVVLLGICEYCERVRMTFDEINTMLDQLKWYLLPNQTQKMLSIILIVAQAPVEFRIFGSVSCNRKICKEVSVSPMRRLIQINKLL